MPSFRFRGKQFRGKREPQMPVLGQETGQSMDENRAEADRLLKVIWEDGFVPSDWERDFLISCEGDRPVTGRMLFKLREIRDRKYL